MQQRRKESPYRRFLDLTNKEIARSCNLNEIPYRTDRVADALLPKMSYRRSGEIQRGVR